MYARLLLLILFLVRLVGVFRANYKCRFVLVVGARA